jgi:hypothetical protein
MSWLLPVGTAGGVNSGFDGIPAGSGFIRLGAELLYLDLDDYRLWRAAAAAPRIDEFLSWGSAQAIPDVPDRLSRLEAAGLLIKTGPGAHSRIGQLALRLVGECLGNGTDISPAFFVLGRDKTQLRVDGYLFEVLLRSDGVSPVSVTCDRLDAARIQPARPLCIETLTEGLPLLVRHQVVQLEAATR